nr:hypothetical protein [Tanacetum cinerariifolium]
MVGDEDVVEFVVDGTWWVKSVRILAGQHHERGGYGDDVTVGDTMYHLVVVSTGDILATDTWKRRHAWKNADFLRLFAAVQKPSTSPTLITRDHIDYSQQQTQFKDLFNHGDEEAVEFVVDGTCWVKYQIIPDTSFYLLSCYFGDGSFDSSQAMPQPDTTVDVNRCEMGGDESHVDATHAANTHTFNHN